MASADLSQSFFSPPLPFSAKIIDKASIPVHKPMPKPVFLKHSFGLNANCRSQLQLNKAFITNSTASGTDSSYTEINPIESSYPTFPTVMDINQILATLPHRYPFLLVDRVIEQIPGVSAVGIKNVTINEHFFSGHVPGRPIMPGVLMVEAMGQVGALVLFQPEMGLGGPRDNFFFAGADKIRFRKPVIAGDTLVMRMALVKLQKRFGMAKMEGQAYVGSDLVCEGEFLLALGSK